MKYRKLHYILTSLISLCSLQSLNAQDGQKYIPKSFEKSYVFHKISQSAVFTFEKLKEPNPFPIQGKYQVIQKESSLHEYTSETKVVEKKTGKLIYEITIPYLNDLDAKRYGAMKENMLGLVNPHRDSEPIFVNTPDLLFASISGHFRYFYNSKAKEFTILPQYCIKNNRGYYMYSWLNLTDNLLISEIYLNSDTEVSGVSPTFGGYVVYDLTTKKLYNVVLNEEIKTHTNITIRPLDKIQSILEVIPFISSGNPEGEPEFLKSLGYYNVVKIKNKTP